MSVKHTSTTSLEALSPVVTDPSEKHWATLIFLHGSGDTGAGVKDWILSLYDRDLSFPHVKIIYPTAISKPYQALEGATSSVWFDRKEMTPSAREEEESIDEACCLLDGLVESEVEKGIPRNRIFMGGFSMGGCLAMYYGLRQGRDLAGLIAIGSFLATDSIVFEYLKKHKGATPPLLQLHGHDDGLILQKWARATHQRLLDLGVQTSFLGIFALRHEMNREQLDRMRGFILRRIPPIVTK